MTTHDEVRAIMILRALSRGDIYPVPVEVAHSVAYFCDALSGVWGIPARKDVLLKTSHVPRDGDLQRGLDRLVGRGMVAIHNVNYSVRDAGFVMDADYDLNEQMCARVFDLFDRDPDWRAEQAVVNEIALAVSAVGKTLVGRVVLSDAAYSDPMVEANSVLALVPDAWAGRSRTQQANDDLNALAIDQLGHGLSPAELTHLYVRHVYSIVGEHRG